ncbi:MAG TPA: DoxX family protein [Flavisolibacter sp.]|nr:DoxX family protein [Flavisolibacter sp.]
MKLKAINTQYWIFTILFSALMIFSSWSSIVIDDDSKKLIHDMLGYPEYFIPFTGWAKLIGVIVILVPGYSRIKEWAYAGLFFDLIAAVYSGICVSKTFDPLMLTLLFWFVPGILSYVYWHKRMRLASNKKAMVENKKEAALSY